VVYGVVPLFLLAGPLGRAGDGDVRHPWVLFVIGATCVSSRSRRGALSRDRSGRGQIADGDAGRTGIMQHSAVLFHVMGRRGCIGTTCHYSGLCRGVRIASGVVRNGTAPWHARVRPRVYLHKIRRARRKPPFAGSDGAGLVPLGSGEAESAVQGSVEPGPTPLESGESEALPSGSGETDFPARGRISPFRDL
jgi:hypothetical protein